MSKKNTAKKALQKRPVKKISKQEFITMLEPDIAYEEKMLNVFERCAKALEDQHKRFKLKW